MRKRAARRRNLPAPKLLQKYVKISVQISLDLISDLSEADLPEDWNSRPISPSTRAIGDHWAKKQSPAALRVPSIVVPDEYNYLLNPSHPDFAQNKIGNPIIYYFDPRLKKKWLRRYEESGMVTWPFESSAGEV